MTADQKLGEAAILSHFEQQAQACDTMGSPLTARIFRSFGESLDRTTRTGARILDWPGDPRADAPGLRLSGGLHALVLSGDDAQLAALYDEGAAADDAAFAAAIAAAVQRWDDRLHDALDNPPQTNEIARSAVLLPGFLAIARRTGLPLALNEIGSSAGLNLHPERFFYRYDTAEWGDAEFGHMLAPSMRGPVPDLSATLTIASRRGCDQRPVRIGDPAERVRLKSYIWPDQTERLARTEAAIGEALANPAAIDEMDAADFVAKRLKERQQGTVFVLYHSVVWQYLPEATKAAISASMAEAGAAAADDAPIAWLAMEGLGGSDPFATLTLRLWPTGEEQVLARADFHGRWLEWLG